MLQNFEYIYEFKQDYVFISKEAVQSEHNHLSLEAIGLLVQMLSRPPEYKITFNTLMLDNCMGRDKLNRILKELKTAGYVRILNVQDKNGRFKTKIWQIVEEPIYHKG